MYVVYNRHTDQEVSEHRKLVAAQKVADRLNDEEEMCLYDVRLDDATMRAAYANV